MPRRGSPSQSQRRSAHCPKPSLRRTHILLDFAPGTSVCAYVATQVRRGSPPGLSGFSQCGRPDDPASVPTGDRHERRQRQDEPNRFQNTQAWQERQGKARAFEERPPGDAAQATQKARQAYKWNRFSVGNFALIRCKRELRASSKSHIAGFRNIGVLKHRTTRKAPMRRCFARIDQAITIA